MPSDPEPKHILFCDFPNGRQPKQHAGAEAMPNNLHGKHSDLLHWSTLQQPKRGGEMVQADEQPQPHEGVQGVSLLQFERYFLMQ